MNTDTLKEMRAKHPEGDLPTLPSGPVPEAIRFDVDLVRKWKVFLLALPQVPLVRGPSFSRTFCHAPTKPLKMPRCRL